MVKALLFALGQALDRGRTLRVVVRDDHQRRFLHNVGLGDDDAGARLARRSDSSGRTCPAAHDATHAPAPQR